MIITGVPTAPCTNPYGDYLLSLSMQNKQDYARLHSYEVHLMAEAVTSHIRAGPWQKVGFIQKVQTPLALICHLAISLHAISSIFLRGACSENPRC